MCCMEDTAKLHRFGAAAKGGADGCMGMCEVVYVCVCFVYVHFCVDMGASEWERTSVAAGGGGDKKGGEGNGGLPTEQPRPMA